MRIGFEQLKKNKFEHLVTAVAVACGISFPQEAGAVTLKPLTAEQMNEVMELKETSPLAAAINAVSETTIREEGYKGDIFERKKRAKSQIPLLYKVRWKIAPVEEMRKSWVFPHPVINVEIFTNGASLYFDYPDDTRLQKLGITRDEIEDVAEEIQEATAVLTDMPARRVNRKEDSNLIVYLSDNPDEASYRENGKAVGHPVYHIGSPISFFPLETVYPINFVEPGKKGGVYIPLESHKDKIEKILSHADYPKDEETREFVKEFTRFIYLRENILWIAVHEICHYLGYGHSNEKGHIVYGESSKNTLVYPKKRSGTEPVVPDGASVYTDKEGDKYYYAPSWGDIRKSPIIDLNFFLRIFAKQNKERQLMEERSKQNKE